MFPNVTPERFETFMVLIAYIGCICLITWIYIALTDDKLSYKEKIIKIMLSMGLIAIGSIFSSFKFFQLIFKSYQYGYLGNLFYLI